MPKWYKEFLRAHMDTVILIEAYHPLLPSSSFICNYLIKFLIYITTAQQALTFYESCLLLHRTPHHEDICWGRSRAPSISNLSTRFPDLLSLGKGKLTSIE
jgi:hypothetical protein